MTIALLLAALLAQASPAPAPAPAVQAGDPLPGFDWFPSAGCLDEARLAYVGLRDVDDEEGRRLRASQCHVWTMRDVDRLGIAGAIERAVRDTSRSPWLTLAWEQSEWFEGFGKVFSPITTLHARAVDIAAARAAVPAHEAAIRRGGGPSSRLHELRRARPGSQRRAAEAMNEDHNDGCLATNAVGARPPQVVASHA